MSSLDEHGRVEPPSDADEAATLLGFLDYQRATLAWKCEGLSAAQLASTTAASSLSLGGLLKHLALVEDWWFASAIEGAALPAPFDAVDFDADPQFEFRTASQDAPEYLLGLWVAAQERSRAVVARALARGDLGQLARPRGEEGRRPSLRWIITHMIEEYARHNGHADLLREAIDGETGE